VYHLKKLKLPKINLKLKKLNFRTIKDTEFPTKHELELLNTWTWQLDLLKETKVKHTEIIADPLIDKLISKINELIGKYC